MIAAVTGGSGFLGAALVKRLTESGRFAQIRVLTRSGAVPEGVLCVRGDLTRSEMDLSRFIDGADVLFHCAGEVRQDSRMRALHVEGTRRLAQAASRRVGRWVQLSSVGAYGRAAREGTIDETSPLAPEGEYENTKVEADAIVSRAADEGGFRVVTLRPSMVLGPGMPNRSLYQLVSAIDRGFFFYVGRRGAVANFVYVDDVAAALCFCATEERARGVYNLSDDRPMEDVIAAIAHELGKPAPRLRVPEAAARSAIRLLGGVPGFPLTESRLDALTRRVRYPATRIRQELGYVFSISIEEGIKRLVADWRAQR